MKKWTRSLYQPNLPLYPGRYVTASAEHIALSKEAAEEGMVLLKNDGGLLPLRKGSKVALFGKGTFDYVKGGGGSGDVTVSYIRNLYDGLKMLKEHVSVYEPLADFYRENVQEQYQKGALPGMTVEPTVSRELIEQARAFADTAIISISRFSGEAWDRSEVSFSEEADPWGENGLPALVGKIFERGDFYLSEQESAMVDAVKSTFPHVIVVLNVGGMVDTSWFKEDTELPAVLLAWQGGMEGGLAAAELLCGKNTPSGKLPDTFAARLEDYPSTENFHESPHYVDYTDDIYVGYRYFETIPGADRRVCYPFGYGLSYTRFEVEPVKISILEGNREYGKKALWAMPETEENKVAGRLDEGIEKGEEVPVVSAENYSCKFDGPQALRIRVLARVVNIGDYAGKEVVQLYYSAPQGLLGKPARELAAFGKTRKLLPGESQVIALEFSASDMASYDDMGKIAEASYVLEAGTYGFYLGTSVENAGILREGLELTEHIVIRKLSHRAVPVGLANRMRADGSYEALPSGPANDPDSSVIGKMTPGTEEAIAPAEKGVERHLAWKVRKEGSHAFSEVAEGKLSLEDFIAQLSDGDLIHLLGGQPNRGVANTFGIGNMPEYGIPNIMTADGPAGVRIGPECGVCTTAFPCATLLASTWNTELLERVGNAGGQELKENNLSVWLTPALNIHRSPLCGRNFEYYSEDPYLAGKMAGALVRGIQSNGVAACPKHFACNNKETNRKQSDSRVSERALREIYLKGFEWIVRESDPWVIMSSYNMVNGHRASENRDLLEGILRDEWGFRGAVVTDWWTRGEQYKEILAGSDIKMGCGFPERVEAAMQEGAVSRRDLERCARRVLELLLKLD